nr:histone H1A, sperm-like [Procambarus clarkii]XP_045586846.1 histone H1A, sperm-like [Procambarus clarkii]XP_045587649.1 histone H1A, sperm-like [Procambarus clarkii]XP_045588329.1 histone H1A, sperm-like [Procambarus clarkii]XP_045588560.1 histone H1A, sperm-like [Procambarus clarkii]XP_045588752.1 histone H1A, sperm-like [Procambarus clarkii]XP_045588876.1 histone H1A, sperm-like [Procambarus clarkii]XP_045589520.1 histone H1A, sperm-like [Procambarus clarkii]
MVEAKPTKKAAAAAAVVATTRKPRVQVAHPKTSQMVLAAVAALKDRKGSSLQAIKKYVVANNKVEAAKIAIYIRRFLKKAVADGILVQTKGSGASGSFKLAVAEKRAVLTPKKATTTKKPSTAAKKAVVTPKKAATSNKPPTALKKKQQQQLVVGNKKPKIKRASKSPKPPKAKKAVKKTTKAK